MLYIGVGIEVYGLADERSMNSALTSDSKHKMIFVLRFFELCLAGSMHATARPYICSNNICPADERMIQQNNSEYKTVVLLIALHISTGKTWHDPTESMYLSSCIQRYQ